jgi:hypothetical protein
VSIQPAVTAQWKHHSCGRAAGRGAVDVSGAGARGAVGVMMRGLR